MFGLPALTALFVFGGFLIAVVLSIVFAVRFSADDEEWATVDDVFTRRS
jgi:hypothetical protein